MPADRLASTVSGAEADRGQSFEFRLVNEAMLLDRAMERPLFGWGGWGRPLMFDPETGRALTIVDGEWIRVLGERGIFGYLAEFLLVLVPLFLLWKSWPKGRKGPPTSEELTLAAMALILGLNMLDLLPNATITPFTWMMAGSAAGAARRMSKGSYFGHNEVGEPVLTKKTGLKAVL